MNEEKFTEGVEERWGRHHRRSGRSRMLPGIFLVVIGILLFLKTADFMIFPHWFFSWPMLLIAFGLISGIRHKFRGPVWIILLIIGSFSLIDTIDPSLNMDRFNWPIVFIGIGLFFIMRPRNRHWIRDGRGSRKFISDGINVEEEDDLSSDRSNYVDVTAVFWRCKKKRTE